MADEEHPYLNLNIGLVSQYTMKLPRQEADKWLEEGWLSLPSNLYVKPDEIVLFNKPKSLAELDANRLVGVHIRGYEKYLGTYGMGGAGFFGFLLEPESGRDYSEYLVYAIWGSGQYILLDNRVIDCHPDFQEQYNSWLRWNFGNANDEYKQLIAEKELLTVIERAVIQSVDLTTNSCTLKLMQNNQVHIMEFLGNDSRLPPFGSGKPREDRTTGDIGNHLLFQHEKAILWTK